MKKLLPPYLIFLFLFSLIPSACKNSSSTNPDPPEEVEFYGYDLTYIRPSINAPNNWDPVAAVLRIKCETQYHSINLVKVDNRRFTGEILSIPTHLKNDTCASNLMYIVDTKRWTRTWQDETGMLFGIPYSVGDIFILKNRKTGVEYQLTKIVLNSLLAPALPPECEPKMAQFKTLKGGVVVNE